MSESVSLDSIGRGIGSRGRNYQGVTPVPDSPRMRLRDRLNSVYTWMPTWWPSVTANLTTATNSDFLCIPCPDDYYAVRVGIIGYGATPQAGTLIKVCPSYTKNNYYTPNNAANTWTTANAPWTTLTTLNAGADSEDVVTVAGAPNGFTTTAVSADPASGLSTIPNVFWTDWNYVSSNLAVGSGGSYPEKTMRWLMVRGLTAYSNTPVAFSNGLLGSNGLGVSYSGLDWVNKGYDMFMGGVKTQDRVTTPSDPTNLATLQANGIATGQIYAIVQFKCMKRVRQIAGIGTSMMCGTTTLSQFNNCVMHAATYQGQKYLGTKPYGWCNLANGGNTSVEQFIRAQKLLVQLQPDAIFIQSHNDNQLDPDGTHQATLAAMQIQFARLCSFLSWLKKNTPNCIPVVVTPFPTSSGVFGNANGQGLQAWLWMYNQCVALQKSGTIVLDVSTPYSGFSGGQMTGLWPAGSLYSDDGQHMNEAGHYQFGIQQIVPLLDSFEQVVWN